MARLLYQGHGSFRIIADNGTVVFIDPYIGTGYDMPADIILVSHQHKDHNKIELITQKPGCTVISNTEALAGGKHNTFTLHGIVIKAVEAKNKNHPSDRCVGFILTVDGLKLYVSCDTSTTKQMASFAAMKLDYTFLCCDGIYNMNLAEAAKAAELIGARFNVPVHMKPGKLFSRAMAEKFAAPNRLIIKAGEEIELK